MTLTARRIGGVELLAGALIAITALHTWWARFALNPDGVSYLDLAARLHAHDLRAFVQGYWSPLYPALVALLSWPGDRSPVSMLVASHLLNGLALVGAILLLRAWGRRAGSPQFTVAALAALMLVSNGLPRIEAVTPDVLSLTLLAWLGYELLARNGERWGPTGIALGAAFLARTSAWPWLLLSLPLRLWGARDAAERRQVVLSSATAVAVAALWIVPLSAVAGHPTLGSSARLNYCWYIESCDSRSPDTHQGQHVAYHDSTLADGQVVTWASFPDSARWTYAPWSDPTAWEAGVLSRHTTPPTPSLMVRYWWRQGNSTFGYWLSPVLLAVLIPWWFVEWSPRMRQHPGAGARRMWMIVALGLVGVFQFVVVHSEPRLIAPSALLAILALLVGPPREPEEAPPVAALRPWAMTLALVVVGGYAFIKLRDGRATEQRLSATIQGMAATRETLAAGGIAPTRIVVLGPALPAIAAAYLSGAHVVAQALPRSVAPLLGHTAEEQSQVLNSLFLPMAQAAWLTTQGGGVSVIPLPAVGAPPSTASPR